MRPVARSRGSQPLAVSQVSRRTDPFGLTLAPDNQFKMQAAYPVNVHAPLAFAINADEGLESPTVEKAKLPFDIPTTPTDKGVDPVMAEMEYFRLLEKEDRL